jgi:sugar O-acyltransferase (sialic acid O-acetyltransferase NeuD family)
MTKPLIIFGTGSLAQLAHYYAVKEMGLSVLGFVVDRDRKNSDECCGLPVLIWETCVASYSPKSVSMYVAVGYRNMQQRQLLFNRAKAAGYTLQNIISFAAFVAKNSRMGENNFIMPGAVIEPNVCLGSNNTVWSNATICHDTFIGGHNFFASNATIGGEVRIGDRCFFGFSSTVLEQRGVGDDLLLAAHSLLLNDGESCGHYQGVPARRIKSFVSSIGISFR